MPETADAVAQDERQDHSEPAPAADAKTEVHAAEFAEAPAEAPAAGSGQLDILLDMDVPVTVVLGGAQVPVRRLLQLGPGSVLRLDKPIEAPAELFLKDSKFAEADVVVVDNQFAVRIGKILGATVPADGPQG